MTRPPQAIRERAAEAPAAAARPDGRTPRQARPLKIERGVLAHAEGSAIASMGRTRVLCTATVEDRVPNWIRGKGKGWVTAEYGMLPRSTGERTPRTSQTGGRAQEIQRMIGRSLRAITDLTAFGERTVILDCDVLEADGGTRTAAINGAMVALHDAFVTLSNRGQLTRAITPDRIPTHHRVIDDVAVHRRTAALLGQVEGEPLEARVGQCLQPRVVEVSAVDAQER